MTKNQSDTPRTDAACDDRKEAFDQWYFRLNGVMPDLLKDDVVRAMWLGWSAGMQCGQSDALSAERAKNVRLIADLDNAWEAFRRMRTLLARTKYGDRLQNQVIAMKGTP